MTTVLDLLTMKREGRRIPMLTAYDHPSALILDRAGIPVLLVGDSVANNVLGYPSTLQVTLEEMLHHCRAVSRAAKRALLVGDLPFASYEASPELAMASAGRLMKEGGMHAVKLEGGVPQAETVRRLTAAGIPVMGHLGLTPQSVYALGGYRVQGREPESRARILAGAKALEEAGAFAVVLEAVPASLAKSVTEALKIPTIGIGAGPDCDGQVLVLHDMLGIWDKVPRFVKRYGDLGSQIEEMARRYAEEVEGGIFPAAEHSYQS